MKVFRLIAAIAAVSTILAACGGSASTDSGTAGQKEMEPLLMLTLSGWTDKEGEVIQSQLKKAGIPVEISQKKDYSTYKQDVDSGSFDLAVSGWNTITGNPDYAVMSLFHTDGDYNNSGLSDPAIDQALEAGRAAAINSGEFIDNYHQVEKLLNENAYFVPIYYEERSIAVSNDISGVINFKSRHARFEDLAWKSSSGRDNAADPLRYAHHTMNLTSFDPAKANDGSVSSIIQNIYARLVNLGENDEIVDGMASAWYSADQINFYFVLRPGLVFADGSPITIDDIAFSLLRAADPDLPGNRVYSVQGNNSEVSGVSADMLPDDVRSRLVSQNGALPIDGHMIVRIVTPQPYGQLYNMLAHTSGGIVKKSAVEAAGDSYGTVDTIDQLLASGPYRLVAVDPQANEVTLRRNPNYYQPAELETVVYKIIEDKSAQVLALKAGDIDYMIQVPAQSWQGIVDTAGLQLIRKQSNSVKHLDFNLAIADRPTMDKDLRLAIYYAIDPEEVLQIVRSGNGGVAASELTPVLLGTGGETGYLRPDFSLEKSKEHLNAYLGRL